MSSGNEQVLGTAVQVGIGEKYHYGMDE